MITAYGRGVCPHIGCSPDLRLDFDGGLNENPRPHECAGICRDTGEIPFPGSSVGRAVDC